MRTSGLQKNSRTPDDLCPWQFGHLSKRPIAFRPLLTEGLAFSGQSLLQLYDNKYNCQAKKCNHPSIILGVRLVSWGNNIVPACVPDS